MTDNLLSQGTIDTEVLAVSFEPATSDSDANGELTFGGTDSSKFTGDIAYVYVSAAPLYCSARSLIHCTQVSDLYLPRERVLGY